MIGNFTLLRYSLIKELQTGIDIEELPKPKGAVVKKVLKTDKDFTSGGTTYAFLGFHEVKPSDVYQFEKKRYLVGKLAKLKKVSLGERVTNDIVLHEEDDWIPIIVIFDIIEQYILVQNNYKFGNTRQIINAIQYGLRDDILSFYNHKIFIEPKTEKNSFWEIADNHRKIYRVEINLISPNILRTNEKARDVLEELKKLYNQDELNLELESKTGNLRLPKASINDYIDYVSEGEGSWSIVTEGERSAKKKHNSENEAIRLELDIPEIEKIYSESQLELETRSPAPGRDSSDARLVADAITIMKKFERSND